MEKLSKIQLLIQNSNYNSALIELNKIIDEDKKDYNLFYLRGFCYLNLNEIKKAIHNFSTAIDINDTNFVIFFYRGLAYFKLNEFKNAKFDYNKAIKLKPDLPELYNNLANFHHRIGEYDDAINNYLKSIHLNKNFTNSITGLLNVLTQATDLKVQNSSIIKIHNQINKLNFDYSNNEYIEDYKIKTILNKLNEIVDKNFETLQIDTVQIYREKKSQLNCNRHHKIFNEYKIIPEYCFGCYKIQIEPDNVLDLIKLYFIFDNLDILQNNIRKCMIELRPNINGKYKGLIYCNSIKESEYLLNKLKSIFNINFDKKINCKIKRGCTEFSMKYLNYDNLEDNALKYNSEWKEKENFFDKNYPDLSFKVKTNKTIKGISLLDVLVIRNWLAFARMTEDDTCRLSSKKIYYSKMIENKIKSLNL